jgi:hypothetical protein
MFAPFACTTGTLEESERKDKALRGIMRKLKGGARYLAGT